MNKNISIKTIILFFIGFCVYSQSIVWTGSNLNNDFFDEGNWRDSVTDIAPINGVIDPGVAINLTLQINNFDSTINASGIIVLGTGSLTLSSANISATSFSGGNVVLNEGAYIELNSSDPFSNSTEINIKSGISWIKSLKTNARTVFENYLAQIKINGNTAIYKNNLRLDNYYLNGCVIRSNDISTSPLIIYDNLNLQGNATPITVNKIHSGTAIANSMDNKMQSFVLKKGFMLTIAVSSDGTGSSKNYIASETDLIINNLPIVLRNSISFIRVIPWNWVTKKGRTDIGTDLNTSWRYKWNNTESSSLDTEFAPMSWGGSGANDAADIALYVSKYNSTHVMAFNEADNCFGQSGQYGNPKLCVIDEAVRLYKNLMKTGMRLVSPNGTEGAATTWLKEFHTKATAQDIRIDVIGVHWYDWGSNPKNNLNPTANQVFERFKTYLNTVYNLYKLPIWITEFNANPWRSTEIQQGFMELALPYLESLDYVERYNWFQPNPTPDDETDNANKVGPGEFYTTRPPGSAILTPLGITYKNQVSTPSIPEATVDANNNLNLLSFPNIALRKLATANSSYDVTSLPSNAVDGNSTTTPFWFVNIKRTTDVNYAPLPAWIEVDLQGNFTIDSFRIFESSSAVKDFSFEVWDASMNSGAGGWSSVVNVTGNPSTSLTTFRTFTQVTTSKVRLYITDHYSTSYLRILELEVYGKLAETLTSKEFVKQAFSLYPNPTNNDTIQISGDEEVHSIEVFDVLGIQKKVNREKNKVSIENLSSGVYFLKINNQYSFKFIKK